MKIHGPKNKIKLTDKYLLLHAITQKKPYNIQNKANVWNQEVFTVCRYI